MKYENQELVDNIQSIADNILKEKNSKPLKIQNSSNNQGSVAQPG